MTGRMTPRASSGTTWPSKRWVASAFSPDGRDRSTVPRTTNRLPSNAPMSSSARAPAMRPTMTIRPLGAAAATSTPRYGPPRRSTTTSIGPAAALISAARAAGSKPDGARIGWSRPSSAARSSLSLERLVPATDAPKHRASWKAAVPTPEATAWMSTRCPAISPPWTTMAS